MSKPDLRAVGATHHWGRVLDLGLESDVILECAGAGSVIADSIQQVVSEGVGYDRSMLDDDQRRPILPVGASWRFGVGAPYAWSQDLTLSGAYEMAWGGDLSMDVQREQFNRVSGDYTSTAIHVLNLSAV